MLFEGCEYSVAEQQHGLLLLKKKEKMLLKTAPTNENIHIPQKKVVDLCLPKLHQLSILAIAIFLELRI